jgi:2-phospho-L-lactate guanylyltransferase
MPIWAIVPVKAFAAAKSRLAGVLSAEARVALSREFLNHTLQVLTTSAAIEQTLVVSADAAALAVARTWGAETLAEQVADLNGALTAGTRLALGQGATAVLVLPTDLANVSEEAVAHLIEQSHSTSIIIAPDQRGTGTNALVVRPPGALPYAFGEHSFQRHLALAAARGLRVQVCNLPHLAFDVDLPEDLAGWRGASKQVNK